MIVEQHYLECLSQASYFIGDESSGRAVVVDPRRDVSPYLASAREHGMRVEMILETHFHADFLSGHLELSEKTGASIAYGDKAETEFASRKLADGERIELGEVVLEIRHTPGHTPESISIVVYETADAAPYGVLTGDTMFIGDVGRPDLMSSIGMKSEDLASDLYDSLHNQLMTLPDATILYPGHGAGSSCGKNLSSETTSTIGEQRTNNYAVASMSRDDFIRVVTDGQTAPPGYFSYDAMLNRKERGLLDEHQMPTALTFDEVLEQLADGAVVLDTRAPDGFALGHISGSINIGLDGRFAEFAGGVISPDDRLVIVADGGRELESKVRLARIGFDNVVGYLPEPEAAMLKSAGPIPKSSRVDVAGLSNAIDTLDSLQLVDIRQPGETASGFIDGAMLIPLTQLNDRIDELDWSRPTIVFCAGGYRSSIAASRLVNAGFDNVSDVLGGYGAWDAAHEKA